MKVRYQNRRTPPPIVLIALGILLFIGVPRLIPVMLSQVINFLNTPPDAIAPNSAQAAIMRRMSLGERLLFTSQGTPEQRKGVQAFAEGNYQAAATYFQWALSQRPNDPEMSIYLNNSRVSDRPALRIAVSVPIGSNPNVAQEMLRGVAQAQDEINRQGGIRGIPLQVQIANDDNDSEIAKRIAEALVNDPKILAVIGHNASNASLAAAPIYQQAGLVMVSPTSFANPLSGFGDYIFRTVPNIQSMAVPLAEHIINQEGLQKIAVCYDSQAPDNVSFRDEAVVALAQLGGQLAPIVCDFAAPTFDPTTTMTAIRNSQAQAILMAPHIDRIHRAIALIQSNQAQLPLFGSPTFYTMQTLQEGKQDVLGMTLSVPWFPTEPFASTAERRWGGRVNWRTANSYDATQVMIAGLQESSTREGLQKLLRHPSFAALGAGGRVQFLATGDRAGRGILVQVVTDNNRNLGFGLLRP